jgi:hypothetical protein
LKKLEKAAAAKSKDKGKKHEVWEESFDILVAKQLSGLESALHNARR